MPLKLQLRNKSFGRLEANKSIMIKQMLNSQGFSCHKCTSDTEEGLTSYVAQMAGMPVLRR